jgi:uncharacterized Zn-binding protein involved in type VI secretion
MPAIAFLGALVRGHVDIQGNYPDSEITSGSDDVFAGGKKVSRNNDTVFVHSHPHQIVLGVPTDYQEHTFHILANRPEKANGEPVGVVGDATVEDPDHKIQEGIDSVVVG